MCKWSQRENTVQIFNILNKSKIDSSYQALTMWDWAIFEHGGCICVEGRCVLCRIYNTFVMIFSSSYSTVKRSFRYRSTCTIYQTYCSRKKISLHGCQTVSEKVIEHENVRGIRSRFQLISRWIAGFVQYIKATIHAAHSCFEITK